MNDCKPFRPRSGARHRCHHRRLLGETSQPEFHTLASVLHPDPVRMLLRTSASSPIPQGRHRDPDAPDTEKLGCDRLPCATGLVSYPSSCVFLLLRTTPLFGASRCSDLIASPRSSPAFRRLLIGSLNPRQSISLFSFRLRRRFNSIAMLFVQNHQMVDHHTGSQ